LIAETLPPTISPISCSEWPSTSLRMTLLRCAGGSRMNVLRLAAAIWRSSMDSVRRRSCPDPRSNAGLLAHATAQEVQSGVVRDAKQPALRVGDGSCGRRRLHRLSMVS
jgi:hypothetical protein